MNRTTEVISQALNDLSTQPLEQHAQIRQALYEQLNLNQSQQFALFSKVLGPVSSGKLMDYDKGLHNALSIVSS